MPPQTLITQIRSRVCPNLVVNNSGELNYYRIFGRSRIFIRCAKGRRPRSGTQCAYICVSATIPSMLRGHRSAEIPLSRARILSFIICRPRSSNGDVPGRPLYRRRARMPNIRDQLKRTKRTDRTYYRYAQNGLQKDRANLRSDKLLKGEPPPRDG